MSRLELIIGFAMFCEDLLPLFSHDRLAGWRAACLPLPFSRFEFLYEFSVAMGVI